MTELSDLFGDPATLSDDAPEARPVNRLKCDPKHIKYFFDIIQGSYEWAELRRGVLTASEVHHIITPTLKVASNDKERTHVSEIAVQRTTRYVEPTYYNDDMLRGHDDEIDAKDIYRPNFWEVTECGFITNDQWGFTLGYSPDGLVGDDGLIEIKSRKQRLQFQLICDCVPAKIIPPDHVMQCQTAMLITGRKWCDFISYSGGMPMAVIRVGADYEIQEAILDAAIEFESRVNAKMIKYKETVKEFKLIPTKRREIQEIV